MGRIFDKDGLNCIEPPATTPTPRSSPTRHHAHNWTLSFKNHGACSPPHPSMTIFQANTYPRPISCKSSGSHVSLRYLLTILPDRDTLKIVLFFSLNHLDCLCDDHPHPLWGAQDLRPCAGKETNTRSFSRRKYKYVYFIKKKIKNSGV